MINHTVLFSHHAVSQLIPPVLSGNAYICIYIYIYICVCVCVCVCLFAEQLGQPHPFGVVRVLAGGLG